MIAFFPRQYDSAINQFERIGKEWVAIAGLCYAQKKMYPEAIANLEKGVAIMGRQGAEIGFLAQAYGLARRKRDAQKIIGELNERSRHHYIFPSIFANAYLGLGDKGRALTYLERAYAEQDPWLYYLKVCQL